MQTNCKIAVAATCVGTMAICLPLLANACVLVYPTVHVGTEFRVHVSRDGRPVASLRLALYRREKSNPGIGSATYSETDKSGSTRFTELSPGSYFLRAEHDAGVPDGFEVDVSPNGPRDVTVSLRWPNQRPLDVESAKGELHTFDYYPSKTQSQFSLSLVEGVSGNVIARTETDSKGWFDFNLDALPGIYFIQLSLGGHRASSEPRDLGDIAIEIARPAERKLLDLDIGWTDCGLSYAERVKYPDIKSHQICGEITDSLGEAISNAQVMLLEDGKGTEVLQETRSAADGRFTFAGQPEGVYQLLIKSRGFRPFLRIVHLEPVSPTQACQEPIVVQLEPL
jgi:hypothetical protein